MYTHAYTFAYIHTYAHTHAHIHSHISIHTCTLTYIHMHIDHAASLQSAKIRGVVIMLAWLHFLLDFLSVPPGLFFFLRSLQHPISVYICGFCSYKDEEWVNKIPHTQKTQSHIQKSTLHVSTIGSKHASNDLQNIFSHHLPPHFVSPEVTVLHSQLCLFPSPCMYPCLPTLTNIHIYYINKPNNSFTPISSFFLLSLNSFIHSFFLSSIL